MATNLFFKLGGSKFFLLPLTGVAMAGAAASYGSYRVARAWTGSALGVDFEEAGTLCQVAATVGGAGAAGGFLLARFSSPRYKPAKFRDIMAKVEEELQHTDKTVTRTVTSKGTVISSTVQSARPPPPSSAPAVHGFAYQMRHRMRLFLRAARVPVRFQLVNVVGASMLLGSFTSLSQRIVCGRTGSESEVGKLPTEKDKLMAAAAAAAARAAGVAPPAFAARKQPVAVELAPPAAVAADADEFESPSPSPAQASQSQAPSIALSPTAQAIQVAPNGAHLKPEHQ